MFVITSVRTIYWALTKWEEWGAQHNGERKGLLLCILLMRKVKIAKVS